MARRTLYLGLGLVLVAGCQSPGEIQQMIEAALGQPVVVTASDGATGDTFGTSAALDGDTAVIGAPANDAKGADSGAAYVFQRGATGWVEQAKLVPSDGAAGDRFGHAVALSNNTVVVSANLKTAKAGGAYVFVRTGTTWSEQAKLTAADAKAGDNGGYSVGLDQDTVAMGAPGSGGTGAVHVFVRTGTTWSEQTKLTASDAGAGDALGNAVAVEANTVLAGAPFDDDGSPQAGAAYVFVRTGSTWSQQTKLVATPPGSGIALGSAVALSGNTALLTAPYDDSKASDAGAAYVFVRSGTTWSQQTKLTASDGTSGDQFGKSVALDQNTAVVGTPLEDPKGQDSGAAYLFQRTGTTWAQTTKLAAGAKGSNVSTGIAVSQGTFLAGAPGDSSKTGAGYIFEDTLPTGTACTGATQCQSGFCVDGVCCASTCTGGCQACSVQAGATADGTCTLLGAGVECRTAAGECDTAEACDGTATSCPADLFKANDTPCAGGSCLDGVCHAATDGTASDGVAGDAKPAGDGGATDSGAIDSGTPGGGDDDGCNCRVGHLTPVLTGSWWLLLATSLLWWRTRRRD